MKYVVNKEKGSSRFFVCKESERDTPLTSYFTENKKALKEAARMSNMTYKDYMKCYRKECQDDSDN